MGSPGLPVSRAGTWPYPTRSTCKGLGRGLCALLLHPADPHPLLLHTKKKNPPKTPLPPSPSPYPHIPIPGCRQRCGVTWWLRGLPAPQHPQCPPQHHQYPYWAGMSPCLPPWMCALLPPKPAAPGCAPPAPSPALISSSALGKSLGKERVRIPSSFSSELPSCRCSPVPSCSPGRAEAPCGRVFWSLFQLAA